MEIRVFLKPAWCLVCSRCSRILIISFSLSLPSEKLLLHIHSESLCLVYWQFRIETSFPISKPAHVSCICATASSFFSKQWRAATAQDWQAPTCDHQALYAQVCREFSRLGGTSTGLLSELLLSPLHRGHLRQRESRPMGARFLNSFQAKGTGLTTTNSRAKTKTDTKQLKINYLNL